MILDFLTKISANIEKALVSLGLYCSVESVP